MGEGEDGWCGCSYKGCGESSEMSSRERKGSWKEKQDRIVRVKGVNMIKKTQVSIREQGGEREG